MDTVKTPVMLALLFLSLAGTAEVLVDCDFSAGATTQGWTDVHQHTPPRGQDYVLATETDGTFLHTAPIYFGISHRLSRPLVLNDKLVKVTVQVTFRQPKEHRGHPIGIALSSRETVARDAGQAFWKLRDSGFLVNGYSHSLLNANWLCWQRDGRQVRAPKAQSPHNLLLALDTWTTWTLVYDHCAHRLDFFADATASMPCHSLYGVGLDGVELNSVWISAWGAEYRSVKVTVESK